MVSLGLNDPDIYMIKNYELITAIHTYLIQIISGVIIKQDKSIFNFKALFDVKVQV